MLTPPRRVTIYINGKEVEASVIFGFFVFSPSKQPPMSATRTYSPLPPMIPAGDDFRADPCGPREPDPCPHTYGVRVCSCAAVGIAHRPFRHTRSHPRPTTTTVWRNLQQHPQCAATTTTLHSPLSTLHSSHTFSAKEKDSETGLSYFGARYYSSDLSIWLSVDPMSGKYPHQSNYVYCSNNPSKIIDPNGEDEWEVNETGYIRCIHNDKPDRLYAVSGTQKGEWGERKTDVQPLDVNKSIMNTFQLQGENYYHAAVYPLTSNIRSGGNLKTRDMLIKENGFVRCQPLFILRNGGKEYVY